MDSAQARQMGVAFEALLLQPLLGTLLSPADTLGEYGSDLVAREIARRDAHGFGALLASRLEREP